MKFKLFLLPAVIFFYFQSSAQQFIDKGTVEYQVKTNVFKTMGSGMFADIIKDKIQEFKTAFYTLTFSGDKSTYKFSSWDDGTNQFTRNWNKTDESGLWYFDFKDQNCLIKKDFYSSVINISDSIPRFDWKLVPGESREIAGFNCRKAQAILYDSVYIFAFYTEEITFPGGPAGFYGLPGTILGVTVPRLYTSWIATKVSLTGLNEAAINPGKVKKSMTFKEFTALVTDRTSDMFSSSDAEQDKELREMKDKTFWRIRL